MTPQESAILGCILGTAAGDSIGLPYEGLSARRARRMLGEPDRHRLLLGRGMVSDDTEHTCMVAQALIASGGEVNAFARDFARRLRWWLLALPAGVGLATARATLKLWIGFPPSRSGVWSAGNGPAMRSAILGAAIDDLDHLQDLVRASTRVTHTDPKAEHAAFAVAFAAWMGRRNAGLIPFEYLQQLRRRLSASEAGEFIILVEKVAHSVDRHESTSEFVHLIGLERGVSGYAFHTVPVALHAWFTYRHSFRDGVMAVIRCGGDADTTGAITGALLGTTLGPAVIPPDWLEKLIEWPRNVQWMQQLGLTLAKCVGGDRQKPPAIPVLSTPARNVLFLTIVLAHGLRRLLPPYW